MIANLLFVQETFDKFNALCFGNALPEVRIKLVDARSFLGKLSFVSQRSFWGRRLANQDYVLKISTHFDLPENECEDVVIHEMIHYYIAWRGIRDSSSHGPVFRQMMEKINSEFGRHVTLRHHSAEILPRVMQRSENFICVSQLADGRWGLTSCSKTKIPELNRMLPRYYRVDSLTWYVTDDNFFNRYPRSRTPKIYKITRAELDEHLKTTRPITSMPPNF